MLKTKLTALGTSVLLALMTLAGFTVTAAPASAGVTCTSYGICGDLYHTPSSDRAYVTYTCSYGDPWRTATSLGRGLWGTCTDVDGFLVPSGCTGRWYTGRGYQYYYAGWNKIYDNQNVKLELVC